MNDATLLLTGLLAAGSLASAAPAVDEEVFGKMLGGWNEKAGRAASYEVSGSEYLTWKPHISPTIDGGLFVSVRVDHLRGLLASNDHASLELTFDGAGNVASARSTIALQGRRISSDLIEGGVKAGTKVVGVDQAAKVGTDLIGNLSAKLLREKVSEPGRVGFPAVLRHNYNLLILSVRQVDDRAVPTGGNGLAVRAVPVKEAEEPPAGETGKTAPASDPGAPAAGQPATDAPAAPPAPEESAGEDAEGQEGGRVVPPLEIDQHGKPRAPELPVPEQE